MPLLVSSILEKAQDFKATDAYIEPSVDKVQLCFRVDGVMIHVADLPRELNPNIVARFKFLANLLSYRQDIPRKAVSRRVPSMAPRFASVLSQPFMVRGLHFVCFVVKIGASTWKTLALKLKSLGFLKMRSMSVQEPFFLRDLEEVVKPPASTLALVISPGLRKIEDIS